MGTPQAGGKSKKGKASPAPLIMSGETTPMSYSPGRVTPNTPSRAGSLRSRASNEMDMHFDSEYGAQAGQTQMTGTATPWKHSQLARQLSSELSHTTMESNERAMAMDNERRRME